MSEWEELQPAFREAVLRRGDKTLTDVADEAHIGRKTLCRLMNGEGLPTKAVQGCVERYLADRCQMTLPSLADDDD